MKSAQTTGLVVAILIAAAAAGFGAYQWMQPDRAAKLAQQEAAAPAAMSPQAAMSLSMNDLKGNRHSLSDWHGKVVLVNFWATWCPPCRKEMPLLVKLQAKYAARGLQVVGIATDETSEDTVRAFTRRIMVNYPILMGPEQVSEMVAGLGGNLIGLPYTLLVGRNGKILRRHPGQLDPRATEYWIKTALLAKAPKPQTPARAVSPPPAG